MRWDLYSFVAVIENKIDLYFVALSEHGNADTLNIGEGRNPFAAL